MKSISDKELGIDCDFVATGETREEAIQVATDHIQSEHPEEWDRVKGMLKMHVQTV